MTIWSFSADGYDGNLVRIEVDLRRGIPGVDIIGLPDSAVLESRDRIRAAIRNSGYEFPRERVLINLAPAGLRKEGASFDLALAAGILTASGGIKNTPDNGILIMGELMLSGEIRPVNGVLSAVSAAYNKGIKTIVVPDANMAEGASLEGGIVYGISSLNNLQKLFYDIAEGKSTKKPELLGEKYRAGENRIVDFADIRGLPVVKRALEIAAAGRHNLFLFGPPGGGKTMAARSLAGILPELSNEEAIEVTKIYSTAGLLPAEAGLMKQAPFREPHHSASEEGLIGGGRGIKPGEVSLAHHGVLFLDETPEFRKNLLQSLREPSEEGHVDLVRAGKVISFPADFQLVMAANPCPCGNLGKQDGICTCSKKEVMNYWKKIGGAMMDRIDIRVPVEPVDPSELTGQNKENSNDVIDKIERAVLIQKKRFSGENYKRNARIAPSGIRTYCRLEQEAEAEFLNASRLLGLSSRACVSVLKTSRTIADLAGREGLVTTDDVFEAIQHRRYGERDFFWEKV